MAGTEDDIMSSIATNDGSVGSTTDTGGSGASTDTSSATLTPTTGTDAGTGQAKPTDSQGSGADNAAKPGDQAKPGQAQAPQNKPQARHPGDLVDPVTGQVLAKAGLERRVFHSGQNYERTRLNTEMNSLKQQIETLKQVSNAGTQLGLDPRETAMGATMMAAWKRDPANFLNAMLTEAKKNGINIDGVGQGVDTNAVARLIDERLAPFTNANKQQQANSAAMTRAQEQYSSFMGQYPDAAVHENDLAAILGDDKGATLGEAYAKLKLFAVEHQLDWSKPLGPQVEARVASRNGANAGNPNSPAQQRPMPNGRNGSAIVAPVNRQGNGFAATERTSTKDIVKFAMQQAGMDVSKL